MLVHLKQRRFTATAALFAASMLVSACGGGGGGGESPAPPPLGTGTQACAATSGTGGAGYTVGACVVQTTLNGNTTETTTSQFQDVLVTVAVDQAPPAVADPNQGKSYSLSVGLPPASGGGGTGFGSPNRFCLNSGLGDRRGYITEEYTDPTKPESSPRFTLLSFAKASLIADTGATLLNQLCKANPAALSEIGTITRVSDFGVWERAAGGAAIYYGGWYATRVANSTVPTTAKVFTEGSAVGYRFTPSLIYGVSAKVNAGGSWDGTKMVFQIDNFKYSRAGSGLTQVNPALSVLTLTSDKVDGAKVSGTVVGAGVSGVWEGTFAGAGEELVGRIRFTQTGQTVEDKFVGSFALK
jgi:hypothetical protein